MDLNGVLTMLGGATTDGTGAFSAIVTIPASAPGAGKVTGEGALSKLKASKTFTVT